MKGLIKKIKLFIDKRKDDKGKLEILKIVKDLTVTHLFTKKNYTITFTLNGIIHSEFKVKYKWFSKTNLNDLLNIIINDAKII